MTSIAPLNSFARTRLDHSRETAEDYVELIAALTAEVGEARVTDLADRLGVSKVTVGKTVQRLATLGLVKAEKYRSIFLTEEGRALAQACRERHTLVLDFLIALGVEAETAETDAEGIEHHVSQETLAAMREFIRRQNQSGPTRR